MKQVFLDTNVIIDYLGNRTGFYDDAAIIMSLAINQKIKLYAAAISDFEDFEDAMQYKCAEKAKADYIVTRNIKDFKTASIKVGTPEDFLEDFINQY